ncbi:hypothetical protein [Salipaludibacillus aurantiacus]|uniref:Uncharacterized protein n=1 Tax=Salipaludibacillus aurantiacus TaxID=1601833 RepID=A0A1H9U1Q8_9BACI|nr:hypothetical protein [Salipaludibacillus aurantiacus]SES03013.1 hypothetical protein SAMN05518684_106220 [Salipaludibacillus aurantiacus]
MKVNTETYSGHEETIKRMESVYLTKEPGETVVILEELDFTFTRSELAEIKRLWKKGVTLQEMTRKLYRNENELFLAVFHLTFQNRKNGTDGIALNLSQILGGRHEQN